MYKQSLFASLAIMMLSTTSFANENTEETKKIDDIVITAKSNKSIKDTSGAITVITSEDIAKINATNIKDILVKTAGIVEVGGSNGIKRVSIRGTRPVDALILVDGKKTNRTGIYATAADFEYSQVPISMIERIEIIKGPKSSIYGSDAMGGVVNIITKKDYSKAIWGDIDLQAGVSSAKNGGDEQNLSANIGGNISDKFSFMLGVNKFNRDETYGEGYRWVGFYKPKVDDATYIDGRESTNGNLKLKYNIDDTQNIYASYLKGKEDIKQKANEDYYSADRDVWSVGYEKNFEKVSLSLDYTNAKTDAKIKDGLFANQTHELKNDYLKGEAKISALKNNYIVIGAETAKEKYARYRPTTNITDQQFEIRANSYYIQDEIEFGDFIFTLGTVLDDNEKYGTELSPNIGVVYKIDDNQRLKASYGEGFKAPDVKIGSSSYFANTTWGNDDLKPETSKSYELAYEFYGENTLFKTALFQNKINNMFVIEQRVMPGNQHQWRNVDKADIKGFETEVEYYITDNHMLNANYTLLKTENKSGTNKGKDIQYRPKNTINIGLSSDFDYGISSYLSANYIGTQYKNADNSEKIKAYTMANAQISKKLTNDLSVRVGVDNIFDKHFDETIDNADYLKRRFAYVGLNYKF
ncbi:TonB-dependent receptor [Arcobacter lanthieri]|uniref:TonB-dependent receptor plug domain-containing protein n=1 Tax=Aliarcobacter lanthieri TaxID=1355374 RepID=UPI00192427D2|nr:TonB-dependent receptor [Aliarcobacter lanthieri]MBL3520201.1 TonB-dependent receptor [Aliarcobacter lanthieri]